MASENRDIKLSYKADISNLQQQLASIPGITEKEAKEMAKALDRQLRKAETAAKKAATASRKEWRQFEQSVKDAGVASEEFADQTGDTNSILAGMAGTLDMINPALGNAARTAGELSGGLEAVAKATFKINPIMVAAGAAIAAVSAAYFILKGDAEAAEEATEEAKKEAERASKVYGSLERALQRVSDEWRIYTGELTELEVKQQQAARTITDAHAPALTLHEEKLASLREQMAALSGEENGRAKNLKEQLASMGAASAEQAKLAAAIQAEEKALKDLKAQQETAIHQAQVLITNKEFERISRERAKEETQRATKATKASSAATKAAIKTEIALTSAIGTSGEAIAKLEAEQSKRAAGEAKLAAIISAANADQINAYDEIENRIADQIGQIEALEMSYGEMTGTREAVQAIEERGIRELMRLRDEADARETEQAQQRLERIAAENEERRAGMVTLLSSTSESFATFSEMAAESSGKASIRLFRLSQAAAIGEVAMNTAEAITKVTAQLGILAPAGIAAVSALGAAQAAVIASESPPSFHAGMAPDERNARLLQGEGVLSRQGVAAAGGAQAVRELNNGNAGSGQIVVQNVYRHRVFDSFVQDNLNRAGPLRAALKRGSGRVGHK